MFFKMPSIFTSLLASLAVLSPVIADYLVDPSFKIDVHSHIIPDIYRTALIEGGYPVENGRVVTDGIPAPDWDLKTHIAAMDTNGINYSTISITAPGLNFLAHDRNAAKSLARKINFAMYNYTQLYPTRLGAMCILPLPDVESAVVEIKVLIDNHLTKKAN